MYLQIAVGDNLFVLPLTREWIEISTEPALPSRRALFSLLRGSGLKYRRAVRFIPYHAFSLLRGSGLKYRSPWKRLKRRPFSLLRGSGLKYRGSRI